MRILLVEDEVVLAKAVRQGLTEEGFSVDLAPDGEAGLFSAESRDYDLVVLDLMLPRMDGWAVLGRIRARKRTPVLLLTARDAVEDRVRGLNAGADDYLVKPFAFEELLARVRALVRRSSGHTAPLLRLGEDVEVDSVSRTVRKAGRPVDLTAKEYALTELFALHRGELVTRTQIYDHIYDEGEDTLSNVVDVYVSALRRKLGKGILETRRGQGYLVRG